VVAKWSPDQRPSASAERGKFCRRGMFCRPPAPRRAGETVVFSMFFYLARGLLKTTRQWAAAVCGTSRSIVMLSPLGAASSALNLLQSLTGKKASPTEAITGKTKATKAEFDLTSAAGKPSEKTPGTKPGSFSSLHPGVLSPDLMNALISAQSQASDASKPPASTSKSDALKDLFSLLDSDGNGKISKSEFEDKLGAGGTNTANADSVFGKLDQDGDGSVSIKELASALKLDGHDRHRHGVDKSGGSGGDGGSDPTQGASSTSTSNSDGTTTTTLTYADGSKVSMTSAPTTGTSSSGATSSYNYIERMIQRQAQALAASTTSSLSVSV